MIMLAWIAISPMERSSHPLDVSGATTTLGLIAINWVTMLNAVKSDDLSNLRRIRGISCDVGRNVLRYTPGGAIKREER